MQHLFLINPAAGTKDSTERYQKEIHAAMKKRMLPYRIRVSKKPGDLTAFAREAAESGEEYRIYACGGDGTLNEVVNGIAGFSNIAVTHYPGGSGNDFIKLFSDPSRFNDIEELIDGQESVFDLIQTNDRYGIDICSVGLDARIGTSGYKYKRIPLVTGSGAYLISIAVNLFKGITEKYTVSWEDESVSGEFTMMCVCNGRWYGGGFNPVPEAMPDDGKLNVLLVKGVKLTDVPKVLMPYKKGKYRDLPEFIRYIESSEITIKCDHETVVNIDGEAMNASEVTFRMIPKAIRFFYPKGLTY